MPGAFALPEIGYKLNCAQLLLEEILRGIKVKKLWVLLALLVLPALAFAQINVSFNDPGYTVVTSQYLATDGITFSNALELTTGDGDVGPAGQGYDYVLPPNGSNVLTDDPADPLTMNMTQQGALAGNYVYSVSGYYTSPIGVTVTAYNSNGVAIATTNLAANNGETSQFTLTVAGCTGASWSAACTIAYVTFSDGGAPDSLVIGELTLDDAPTPEPGTLMLIGTGILGLAGSMRKKLGLMNLKQAMPVVLGVLACVCTFGLASFARVITEPINNEVRIPLPSTHSAAIEAFP
jgi:hypothetical protein